MKSGDDNIKWKGNGKQHTNKNKAVDISQSHTHTYIHLDTHSHFLDQPIFKCKHFKHLTKKPAAAHETNDGVNA